MLQHGWYQSEMFVVFGCIFGRLAASMCWTGDMLSNMVIISTNSSSEGVSFARTTSFCKVISKVQ